MGTFNWDWDNGGPPAEAYSRVSRDLDEVCAEFVTWLDALPSRLTREFDCGTSEQGGDVVVTPTNPAAAPLRIERRGATGGGVVVQMWLGRAASEWVTDCLCDACDGDSAEFIKAAEQMVAVVTGGFREFRQPHKAGRFERLLNGPWLEIGYECEAGSASSASDEVKGELFDVTWLPWERR